MTVGVLLVDRLELTEELFLALRQAHGGLDDDVAEEVAVARAADALDALAAQAERLPALGLGGTLMVATPSSVGISISPPRAAVAKPTGISQCRSSWSRWKIACGLRWSWT